MNYASLKTNINDICETTFTDDQLAMFTQQAEQKIYNTVQIPALRKNVTAATTSSNKYLALPSDFLYSYSMSIYTSAANVHSFLLYKDVNFMREAYPNPSTTGTPKHYSQWSDGFLKVLAISHSFMRHLRELLLCNLLFQMMILRE